MGLVNELDVVWQAVHPLPIDGDSGIKEVPQLDQLRAVCPDEVALAQVFMAEQALFNSWYACRFSRGGGAVTEGALDSHRLDVHIVGEINRLIGRCAHAESLKGGGKDRSSDEYNSQNYYDSNTKANEGNSYFDDCRHLL